MKTTSKALEKCQVELKVELEAADAAAVVKEVEKAFVREARIPGFRPGKAPLELIRKDFAKEISEETVRAMLRKNYAEAVKAEKLDEIGLREVKDAKCTAEGGEFTAIVEVKPTFKLPTYKGLKIAPTKIDVKAEAISAQIEQMRTAHAKYEDAKEGETVSVGDFAQVDYSGTVDGKPILELAPDAKIVAEGKGYWMRVEEGYFLPELVKAVQGMKVGESKDGIEATFDENSSPEALKGRKGVYTMKLTAFRRRILPTDAELVAATKDASIEALTKKIREQLEKRAEEQEKARRENEAIDLVMKKCDFDVPDSQVQNHINYSLNQLAQQAQYMGLTEEYFTKNRDQILKDAEANAVRAVRTYYVIQAIAAEEKIECKDDERAQKVIDLILANAK